MAKIIFGYEMSTCPIRLPYVVTEFKFSVYEKGTVRLKRIRTKHERINGELNFKIISYDSEKIIIPLSVVENIKKYLKSQKKRIDRLPEYICNNSCDGKADIFNFMGKKIHCANISRHDLNKPSEDEITFGSVASFRPQVGIRIMKQENAVLEIFENVYNLLKDYGLKVYSWGFYCDWKI